MPPISRGFRGRRQAEGVANKLPPGQYETRDFPVLSAGPTPRTPLSVWDLTLRSADGQSARWTWDEFVALPRQKITVDIHCVTKWSKFGTNWEGIAIDTLISEGATRGVKTAPYVVARSDGGYTTNVPFADLTNGKAWIAFSYGDAPLAPEHGGPARVLVPHLYFWESAEWVRELRVMGNDAQGVLGSLGYDN